MRHRDAKRSGRAIACATALCLLIGGCATLAVPPPPPELFHDALFAPPTQRIDAAEVFAVSEPMRRYLHALVARDGRSLGHRESLVQALYGKPASAHGLRLDYEAVPTRNAADAFDARAGNCLSLVIMTATLARELDLEVRFQAAVADEAVTRQGDLLIGSGHVNITLVGRGTAMRIGPSEAPLTIDFMPQELLPGMRVRTIDVATVLAMYMNNRAVESIAEGRLDDAYAFAREAIRQQPGFVAGYNTLGVVYQRHGDFDEAERAYRVALARDPGDARVASNMVELRLRRAWPSAGPQAADRTPAADAGTPVAR